MKVYYHLPGLFEFYELYKAFLPLLNTNPEWFYDWCEIGSIYGAPADCIWGGGRVGYGDENPEEVAALMKKYGISARLTFSNSLLKDEHLQDKKCNYLCKLFQNEANAGTKSEENTNGIIVYSDLLMDYINKHYPGYYFVSSTTKVLTDFADLEKEINRDAFEFVVPDFRLNKDFDNLKKLSRVQKDKVEFLCNECCWFDCYDRKNCYENVSRLSLGDSCEEHRCVSPTANLGYKFSEAKKNPGFITVEDIQKIYVPMGFSNFKIEGRSLGSALVLEFLLYYMVKPEYQLNVREEIYLDSTLDIF